MADECVCWCCGAPISVEDGTLTNCQLCGEAICGDCVERVESPHDAPDVLACVGCCETGAVDHDSDRNPDA